MKRFGLALVLLSLFTVALSAPAAAQSADSVEKTLYERMGGYDVIAAMVDDLLPRIGKDPTLGKLISLSQSTKRRNRQLIVDLICKEAGGPCLYNGRTMEASHQGLGISGEHYQIMMRLFDETLDHLQIQGNERKELIALMLSLQDGIVEKEVQ